MNITIVGTGYICLVSGTYFAEMGVYVTCVDVDAQKIQKLTDSILPIDELGLDEGGSSDLKYVLAEARQCYSGWS